MNNSISWLNAKRKLNLDQLDYLLDEVRAFTVFMDNGRTYSNTISDLMILDTVAKDTLFLREEEIPLKTDNQGKVEILVSSEFDGYEVSGKNFLLFFYE